MILGLVDVLVRNGLVDILAPLLVHEGNLSEKSDLHGLSVWESSVRLLFLLEVNDVV